MAGEEVQELPPAPLKKAIYILFMLFTAVLFIAFTYCLLFWNSSCSDVTSCPAFFSGVPAIRRTQGGLSVETRNASYIRLPGGQCDIFSVQWLSDPSGPAYTNISCNLIEYHRNCMKNGRPDINYLFWRWKPFSCELPPFDPFKFMDAMKDKSWAFIGD